MGDVLRIFVEQGGIEIVLPAVIDVIVRRLDLEGDH
jgi:hypothetical protein